MDTQTAKKGDEITIVKNGAEVSGVIMEDPDENGAAIVGFSVDGRYGVERRALGMHVKNEGERALEQLQASADLLFSKVRKAVHDLENAATAYSAQIPSEHKGEIHFPMDNGDHFSKAKGQALDDPYALMLFGIASNMRLVETMKKDFGAMEEANNLMTELEEVLTRTRELFEQAQGEFTADLALANNKFDNVMTPLRIVQVDETNPEANVFFDAIESRRAIDQAFNA